MAVLNEKNNVKYDTEKNEMTFYEDEKEIVKLNEEVDNIYINDNFYMVEENNKKHLVNSKGKSISDKKYESIDKYDENGIAICSESAGSMYLIDSSGKAISNSYNSITHYKDSDYYKVIVKGYCGIINKEGRELISPDKYTYLSVEYAYDSTLKLKTENTDGTYDIYTENGISVEKVNGFVKFEDLYFRVENEEKHTFDYYTYDGKYICSIENAKE